MLLTRMVYGPGGSREPWENASTGSGELDIFTPWRMGLVLGNALVLALQVEKLVLLTLKIEASNDSFT